MADPFSRYYNSYWTTSSKGNGLLGQSASNRRQVKPLSPPSNGPVGQSGQNQPPAVPTVTAAPVTPAAPVAVYNGQQPQPPAPNGIVQGAEAYRAPPPPPANMPSASTNWVSRPGDHPSWATQHADNVRGNQMLAEINARNTAQFWPNAPKPAVGPAPPPGWRADQTEAWGSPEMIARVMAMGISPGRPGLNEPGPADFAGTNYGLYASGPGGGSRAPAPAPPPINTVPYSPPPQMVVEDPGFGRPPATGTFGGSFANSREAPRPFGGDAIVATQPQMPTPMPIPTAPTTSQINVAGMSNLPPPPRDVAQTFDDYRAVMYNPDRLANFRRQNPGWSPPPEMAARMSDGEKFQMLMSEARDNNFNTPDRPQRQQILDLIRSAEQRGETMRDYGSIKALISRNRA